MQISPPPSSRSPSAGVGTPPVRLTAVVIRGLLAAVLAMGVAGLGAAQEPASSAAPKAAGDAAPDTPVTADLRIELTRPVRDSLEHIEKEWPQWLAAFDQDQQQHASEIVDDLLATVEQIGFSRLPDLSAGAALRATEAAGTGNAGRARWALGAAEKLDPGRAGTAFARARVEARTGHPLDALGSYAEGYRRLFAHPIQRELGWIDLGLWALAVLLVAGGLFVSVEMAVKGGALVGDLRRFLGQRFLGPLSLLLAVGALLWPLLLPAPVVALVLYWSVLLWGYGSRSERTVLVGVWLLVGVAPLLVGELSSRAALVLSPPVRGMENLAAGRLQGDLLNDLEQLTALLPDDPAVWHLMADCQRRLGQWETSRSLYRRVLEAEPQNRPALVDLGVYYFNKGNFGNAVRYFQQAISADSEDVVAYYDLSQAYSEAYLFEDSQKALEQAQRIDNLKVSRFMALTSQQRMLTFDGGLARVGEIRRHLAPILAAHGHPTGTSARLSVLVGVAPPLAALAALVAAVLLHLLRRRRGYSEPPLWVRVGHKTVDRWRRALLPGFSSAEAGEGGRGFLSLLVVVALFALPLLRRLTIALPWGYGPGSTLPWVAAIAGLALFFGARLFWELREEL